MSSPRLVHVVPSEIGGPPPPPPRDRDNQYQQSLQQQRPPPPPRRSLTVERQQAAPPGGGKSFISSEQQLHSRPTTSYQPVQNGNHGKLFSSDQQLLHQHHHPPPRISLEMERLTDDRNSQQQLQRLRSGSGRSPYHPNSLETPSDRIQRRTQLKDMQIAAYDMQDRHHHGDDCEQHQNQNHAAKMSGEKHRGSRTIPGSLRGSMQNSQDTESTYPSTVDSKRSLNVSSLENNNNRHQLQHGSSGRSKKAVAPHEHQEAYEDDEVADHNGQHSHKVITATRKHPWDDSYDDASSMSDDIIRPYNTNEYEEQIKPARGRGRRFSYEEINSMNTRMRQNARNHQRHQQTQHTSQLKRKLRIWYKSKIYPYWKIMVAQLLCVIYILLLTFSIPPIGIKDPVSRNIIDPASTDNTNAGVIYVNGAYRPVVAIGSWQQFCLAMSRMSAFSMYPVLIVVFLTKMKATQTFLDKTPFSMYIGAIKESHDFHVFAGRYLAFDVWIHTFFHILRWISQQNIYLLWTSAAGISGLVAVLATPIITFPMMYWKSLNYELRKSLHFAFSYVFAIGMCFHVPPSGMPNGGFIAPVLGTCIVLYTLDAIYTYIFMTERIETTSFYVLSSGVRISMPVSERFQKQSINAGYAYICIPWINSKQWHPFSLFEDPKDPTMQQMFLLKNGDWTEAVHSALSRDTTRPCWIKGPFPSPYSHASLYDNQILVASGIGITPALAAINAFKSSRRINLIWAVRDPEMLEFFLEHLYLDHDGWNLIFYTGAAPLKPSMERGNANIRVIKGRPNLPSLIPNVIYGNESRRASFRLWEESEEQQVLVKKLDDRAIASWGIMYCGGSKGVIKTLQEISIDYNIDLHVDSFAW